MELTCIQERNVSDRLQDFRERMKRSEVEAYWVVKAPNVRYLSGFRGDSSTLVIAQDTTSPANDQMSVTR